MLNVTRDEKTFIKLIDAIQTGEFFQNEYYSKTNTVLFQHEKKIYNNNNIPIWKKYLMIEEKISKKFLKSAE